MDQNLLASGSVGASIVVALGILYKVFVFINHRRIKSTCNGKEVTASIDIDTTNTTPKRTAPLNDSKDGNSVSCNVQKE